MSMTESKAPTKGKTTRPAKTSKKNALAEKIEAALAKAVRKTATLGQMVLTDLNVRKKKSSQASMNEAAWRLQIEVWQNSVILNPVSRRLSRAPFP